jgi:hypothetical protein
MATLTLSTFLGHITEDVDATIEELSCFPSKQGWNDMLIQPSIFPNVIESGSISGDLIHTNIQ